MAEYTAVALQTVAAGADVAFTETAVNGSNCINHREGSGIVKLRGITNQCRARFLVSYSGNIQIPTFRILYNPLVIFDCTPRQRKPSIYPGAGSDRIRWNSNTNRQPDGSRSNGTRQKDGLQPSFIRFQVQKLPTAGRRLSPCRDHALHVPKSCKAF